MHVRDRILGHLGLLTPNSGADEQPEYGAADNKADQPVVAQKGDLRDDVRHNIVRQECNVSAKQDLQDDADRDER